MKPFGQWRAGFSPAGASAPLGRVLACRAKAPRGLKPAVLALFVAVTVTAAHPAFEQVDEILKELSGITGLAPLRKVGRSTITKLEVERFMRDRLKETVKPEELRAEEIALKKFGFVPRDFDLKKATIDLLTEQAAAFYDFRRKKLFLLEASPAMTQQPVLVHELAHALADQHFKLERYMKRENDDDAALARMAVMEGQASWLMAEYLARQRGQSLAASPELVKMMSQVDAAAGQYPVLDSAPLYIRESLMFPYTKGLLFQHAVYQKLGRRAFTEVFRRPPSSTQQILHPELYFEGLHPREPVPPEPPSKKGFKEFAEGSLGEFDHEILLRQYAGEREAGQLAPAWRGGAYRLWEHKDGTVLLSYASSWKDEDSARRFFGAYRKVLAGKWERFGVREESAEQISGHGDGGGFRVRVGGTRVTSLEGLRLVN